MNFDTEHSAKVFIISFSTDCCWLSTCCFNNGIVGLSSACGETISTADRHSGSTFFLLPWFVGLRISTCVESDLAEVIETEELVSMKEELFPIFDAGSDKLSHELIDQYYRLNCEKLNMI